MTRKEPLLQGESSHTGHSSLPGHSVSQAHGLLHKRSPLWWRILHSLGFTCGGTTFIAGSVCFFFPNWVEGAWWSALLYTVGSLGFLLVDVMEFFTFTDCVFLRTNILCSALGSALYVIGSIGFFPSVYDQSDFYGIWGFILGSAAIGSSQLWKVARIGWTEGKGFRICQLYSEEDEMTQTGVEFNASLGAWCFFFGTILFKWKGGVDVACYLASVWIWTWGSVAFTCGAGFLAYRHFVMGV
mmetsp:Transcript_29285/g.57494  ORF Transcript_29285/g.57494 Transcript_29285/m.57494 type:complete len:242 (+) Transcript_29285:120-845(+)